MSVERDASLDARVEDALDELRGRITERYPDARFQVARDPEEPENVDLWTTVDVDDPDEVLDLVIDRLIDLQVEERIPVHVIPIRTTERVLADLRAEPKPRRRIHLSVSSAIRGHPTAESA